MMMMNTMTTTSARTPITIRVICHPIRLCCCVQVFGTSRKDNIALVEIRKVTKGHSLSFCKNVYRNGIRKASPVGCKIEGKHNRVHTVVLKIGRDVACCILGCHPYCYSFLDALYDTIHFSYDTPK